MRRDARTIAGSLCWIVGLQWFAAQTVAQAAWRTPYSLGHNFISDLGAVHCRTEVGLGYVCSPLHDLMNASFVLTGLCILAGVVLLWPRWPRGRLAGTGLVLMGLFGAGKVVVGLAPEDQRLFFHAVGSLGILCGSAGSLLLAIGLWRAARGEAAVFLCIGVAGVAGFVLLLAPSLAPARGALERLAHWPLPLWLAVLGGAFLAGRPPVPSPGALAPGRYAGS